MKFNIQNSFKALALIGAVAGSAVGMSTSARADIIYTVNAMFDDGEHLTGTFSLNVYGYLATVNLTTTGSGTSTLPGDTYTMPGSSSGIIPNAPPPNGFYILPDSDGAYDAQLQLIFDHPLGGTGIYHIVGGELGPSFECAGNYNCYLNGTVNPAEQIVRFIAEGTAIAAVPEPSTWAMMMIGFAGLGYMAFRRQPLVPFA
jgi:hypothetical protein